MAPAFCLQLSGEYCAALRTDDWNINYGVARDCLCLFLTRLSMVQDASAPSVMPNTWEAYKQVLPSKRPIRGR